MVSEKTFYELIAEKRIPRQVQQIICYTIWNHVALFATTKSSTYETTRTI